MPDKPKECIGCPFYGNGKGFLPFSGSGSNGKMIIGDHPTEDDVKKNEHYSGKKGFMMTKALWKAGKGHAKDDYVNGNVLQCVPPTVDSLYTPAGSLAIAHCKVHRDAAVAKYKPEHIVALGKLPLKVLTGVDGGVFSRGYVYESSYGIPTTSTVHPHQIGYGSGGKGEEQGINILLAFIYDLKFGSSKPLPTLPLVIPGTYDNFRRFVNDYQGSPLAVDIETPGKQGKDEDEVDTTDPTFTIIRISFAYVDGADRIVSISMPFVPSYIDGIQQLLQTAGPKLFWNYRYDVPRIRANSIRVEGTIVDVMWRFHFYMSDLPKKLGFATSILSDTIPEWKSKANEDYEVYNAIDSHSTLSNHNKLEDLLQSMGILDLAKNHVDRILMLFDKVSARGNYIDLVAYNNLNNLVTTKCEEVQGELNSGAGFKRYHPEKGYKKTPKDTSGLVQIQVEDVVKFRDLCLCASMLTINKKGKVLKNPKIVCNKDCTLCGGKGRLTTQKTMEVSRWAKPLDFTAAKDDVVRYLQEAGIKVPMTKDGDVTTGKKYLQTMADPFVQKILVYRKYAKIRNTYMKWPMVPSPWPDIMEVHSQWAPNTATGRVSSTGPNYTNIPKDGDLADAFRKCIIAGKGYKIVSRDWSAAEAILTGYFAGDPEYMDLARKDVYTFFMAHHLGTKFDSRDPDLQNKLKGFRVTQPDSTRKKYKSTILGVGYGLAKQGMYIQNPGDFTSPAECGQLIKFFFRLFPKIEEYQKKTVEEAKWQGTLDNPYGRIRWFPDIPGKDGTKAIAQRPQSTLADIAMESLLMIDEHPLISEYLVGFIHDEPVLRSPEGQAEEASEELRKIMERPLPKLGGLVLKTDGKIGDHL